MTDSRAGKVLAAAAVLVVVLAAGVVSGAVEPPVCSVGIDSSGSVQQNAGSCGADLINTDVSDKWAVLVGIADYYGTDNDLPYPAKDATDMRSALINNGWQPEHIRVLLNSSATKSGIQDAIENWLGPNVSADDTVIFFYSGHGTYYSESQYNPDGDNETDGKDEYLCSYSETMEIEDFVADGELDQYLDTLASEHIAVIIDSCFSGGMTKAMMLQSGRETIELPTSNKSPMIFSWDVVNRASPKTMKKPMVQIIDGLYKDIGQDNRVVLMACDDDESSMEISGLENGVFAHYIIEGFQCMADANSDGGVSAEEAFDYAEPLVAYLVGELGQSQHPQMYDSYTGDLQVTSNLSNVLITVDDSGSADYTSIQDAVDAAESCDTVYIYSGTYTESVLVNKPITLQGEGAGVVTIDGGGSPGVLMMAHHASVTGLAIEGAGSYSGIELGYTRCCNISGNNVSNNGCGIGLTHSSDNKIADNICNGNTKLDGVSLWYSCQNNSITNNTVNSNRWSGVYLHSGCNNNSIVNNTANLNRDPGIYLIHSSNNNILTGNIANSNNNHGIKIEGSHDNMVTENTANTNNHRGMYLISSQNNTLTGNTANENECGTYLKSSRNNTLTVNTFSNNSIGVSLVDGVKDDYNNAIDTTNMVNGKPVYYLFDKNNVVLDGLDAGHITFAYCSGCTIKNSNIRNGDGIQLHFSGNNTLTNTTASKNNHNGIYLYYSNNNTINGASVSSNQKNGFCIERSDNNEILGANTSLNSYNGIYLTDSQYNNISRSAIISNSHSGIYLVRSHNNSITSNNASMHADHTGIHLADVNNNHNILYNNTVNNNMYGIRFYKYNCNNNITNNRLDDNNRVGFQFDYSTSYYNNIKDNLVNGDFYYHYVNEKGITIQDITSIADDPSNLGWISLINCTNMSARNLTLANNDYNGNGLFIYKTMNSTFDDINASKNRYGIHLKESDNNTIESSNLSHNAYDGIYLDYSDGNRINDTGAISNNDDGIDLQRSDYNSIESNELLHNKGDGVYLHYSDNNSIKDTEAISNGDDGIYIRDSNNNKISCVDASSNDADGITVIYSHRNNISNSIITSNTDDGINLWGSRYNSIESNELLHNKGDGVELYDSDNNIIYNIATISNGRDGVYIKKSNDNKISCVDASSNGDDGITCTDSSSNNLIYHNNLADNTDKNAYDCCTNQWNSTTAGNYYSDYNGNDSDGNGIGDDPHSIPGGESEDCYPLMGPWHKPYVPGDLNGDDRITAADAAIALQIAASGAHNDAADVSGDGSVTSLDALMILQAAAGNIGL